ncbi:MAG TPA: protein kinase, partial [Gemmatimonadales bacterium]|nr:protein kinase [Gemmatimonadales bacterium]
EAAHTVLGTRVAIKVLHPELARRTGLVERFLQEARVVAQIRSAHVVQVMDIDRTPDGHAYIVMELLEGEPLSSVVERQRKLPIAIASEYTVQILEALEAAHALGVVHRDLKPENVFLTFVGGRPVLKLIDFGIAKARRLEANQKNLTVAGVLMGTAEYMAPEQARSADRVDPRADLYAVGVILYEMIAGVRPVRGDSGEDARVIALKVERGEVVPLVQAAPETPPELAGLVHRAMAARPEMRFATATEMRLALVGVLAGKRAPAGAGAPGMPGGTVAMGVRQPTAAIPGATGAAEFEPPADTVRAPPIATALAPAAYSGAAVPLLAAGSGAPPRSVGRWGALVALSLLLVASVLGILVGTGTFASHSTPPPQPASTPATPEAPVTTSGPIPASTPTTAPVSTSVPTLVPTKPSPPPPRPMPSVHPGPAVDAGPGPFVFPSALPTTLPPFPSVFPGWPQLPLPLPTPPPKQAPPAPAVEY